MVIVGPGPMGLLGVQFAKLCGAKAVALIGLRDDESDWKSAGNAAPIIFFIPTTRRRKKSWS